MHSLWADTVLTFFLQPYPVTVKPCPAKKGNPAEPGKLCLTRHVDPNIVNGVIATYGGYVNVSDNLGQISFPFKQVQPTVKLLITPEITPILMVGNTINHWELQKATPAVMYTIEKKQDDITKLYYWDTQPADIPQDRLIPKETLIIIANPEDIFVPTGVTPTTDNTHIILPPVYVKKEINVLEHTLYMLNLILFFGPVDNLYKKDTLRYSTQLTS
jgi:hypothetical protein